MFDYDTNTFSLNNTICKNCSHRFSRLVEIPDYESLEIDPEIVENLEDNEAILIEQHICLVTQQDLDGVVMRCNHYNDINAKSLFIRNPYE